MPTSDFVMSILFLIFLMIFVLIGTSPAVHRWFDRIGGTAEGEGEGEGGKAAPEKVRVAPGGMSQQTKDYEAIVFQQLALSGDKGRSPKNLADDLHFDRPVVEKALESLRSQGMIRRGGLLGNRFILSGKGRERAVQEGMIPSLRSGGGG